MTNPVATISMDEVSGVILAAGLGTRLKPLTDKIPKVIIPVAGKPLIDYAIEAISKVGVNRVIIVISPWSRYLFDHLGIKHPELDIRIVVQEKPLGVRDAILTATQTVSDKFFLIHHVDNIAKRIHKDLLRAGDSIAALSVEPIPNRGLGVLVRDGKVESFTSFGNAMVSGSYVLSQKAIDFIRDAQVGSDDWGLVQGLAKAMVAGYKIAAIRVPWRVINVNDLPSLLDANRYVIRRWMKARVIVGYSSRIAKNARLSGWVSLGKSCKVGEDAFIENSILMDGVSVGRKSIVRKSIVNSGVIIHDNSKVEDQILT